MDVVQTMAVRTRFEAFMRALITPEISAMIDGYITTRNAEGHAMFKYGGRAWRDVVGKLDDIGTMPPFEQACFLEGNYDIMLFPNTAIPFVGELTLIQTHIEKAIIEQFERMKHGPGLMNGAPIYRLRSYIGDKPRQHTISNGFSYHLVLEVIRPELVGYELTIGDSPDRSILYFEMSNHPLKDIGLFKDLAISKTDPTFLSPIGLLLVSSLLLVDRETEKGMSVDSVRNEYMQRYIIPSIMSNTHVTFHRTITSIEDLYNLMFVVLFDQIFDLSGDVTLYKTAQSTIMQRAFKTYKTIVTSGAVPYNTFMENFNTRILDSPCGGNPDNLDMPSFRVLIIWMLNIFGLSGNDQYRFEKSGGDAIRFYLPETITTTSDIDTKLFYSGIEKRSIQDKIILVVMVLVIFMEKFGYFRIKPEIINVQFGTANYSIAFDTSSQTHLLSCRFLPYFMVPLISVDVRTKCNVRCVIMKTAGYVSKDTEHLLGWHYNNAILDVAFNRTTREDIEHKRLNNRYLSFVQIPSAALTSAVATDRWWLSPIPTKEYLIADIEKMHSEPLLLEARARAGKIEKDRRRIALLRAAPEGIENSEFVVTTLDQFIPVSERYRGVKERLLLIMRLLFSRPVDLHNPANVEELSLVITQFFDSFDEFEKDDRIGLNVTLFAMYLAVGREAKRKISFSDRVRANILSEMTHHIQELIASERKQAQEATERRASTRSNKKGGRQKNRKQTTQKKKQKTIH